MAHANEAAANEAAGRPPSGGARGLVAGAALALALAGCGAGEGLDGSFGAQDVGVATGTAAGVSNTATPNALTVGTGGNAVTYPCPGVTVRSGAATWQATDRSSGALRYQGNIGQLARECAIAGQNMTVKVGIEGRILMGEKGTPGTLQVPLRVAVVQEGPTPNTITTKFFNVPVDLPAGQGQSAFTVIEDQVAFPLTSPGDMERYVIYVGYDPQGEAKTKPAARPRPAATSRPRPSPSASTGGSAPSRPAAPPAADPGAPANDVFGPPPGGNSSSVTTPPASGGSGGFEPPPASSVFAPPPR